MGELLDRRLQRVILSDLQAHYPEIVRIGDFESDEERRRYLVNIAYLAEHGLISTTINHVLSGRPRLAPMSITAKGLDFLADDGGLSAVLGVVTVKLHDDTIRQLLIQKIESAPGDKTTKAKLIAKIKDLPAEALGKLTLEGLDAAMSRAPDLLDMLQNLIG